jgi:hypothetical protein
LTRNPALERCGSGEDDATMCGIVGLFAKEAVLATMLASLGDRGPDSAGFAVYSPPIGDAVKLTLRGPARRWQNRGCSDHAGVSDASSAPPWSGMTSDRRSHPAPALCFVA